MKITPSHMGEGVNFVLGIPSHIGRSTEPRKGSNAIYKALEISFLHLGLKFHQPFFLLLLGMISNPLMVCEIDPSPSYFIPLFGVTKCDNMREILVWVLSSKQLHRGSRSQARRSRAIKDVCFSSLYLCFLG